MKIRLTVKETGKALKLVSAAIDSRPVIPAAGGILIETVGESAVRLTATNGVYRMWQTVSAEVKEEGSVLLDGKKLVNMFSSITANEVTLESGANSAILKGGGARFTLSCMTGEFPKRPEIKEDELSSLTMRAGDLKDALETVRYAICTEQTRMELTGVLMQFRGNSVIMVALDGFRMGLIKKPCIGGGEGRDVIVPAETVAQTVAVCAGLNPDAEVSLATDGRSFTLDAKDLYLDSSLVAGTFIDYKKIIPKDCKTSIRFDRDQMLATLKRAMIVAGRGLLIRVAIRDGELEVASNDNDSRFNEVIPCQKSGNDMETAYNVRYVMDAMTALNADEAQIDLVGPTLAGVLRPVDGGKQLHILLPVRVVNGE